MAVEHIKVTCDEASGVAAPFVTSVTVGVRTVTQESVTGLPVPRTGGDVWSWTIALDVEGDRVLEVWDTTHDGAVTHLAATVAVSCPTATTQPEPTMSVPTLIVEPSVPTSSAPSTTPAPTTVGQGAHPLPALPAGVEAVETSAPATTSVVSVPPTLPATGAATQGAASLGIGLLGVGVVLWWVGRRPGRIVTA